MGFASHLLPIGDLSSIQETINKGDNAVCGIYLLFSASCPRFLFKELLKGSCLMERIFWTPVESPASRDKSVHPRVMSETYSQCKNLKELLRSFLS